MSTKTCVTGDNLVLHKTMVVSLDVCVFILMQTVCVGQKQSTNPDTSGGVRFVIADSGSGPVDAILHDVEESLKRVSTDLRQLEVDFAHKS